MNPDVIYVVLITLIFIQFVAIYYLYNRYRVLKYSIEDIVVAVRKLTNDVKDTTWIVDEHHAETKEKLNRLGQ